MRLLLPLTVAVVLSVLCVGVNGFLGLHSRKTREPPVPSQKSAYAVATKYVTQKVDNFNPRDNRTWSMRYMTNDQYLAANSPIFLMIGGEWTISAGWLQGGLMHDIGRNNSAFLVYSEHRYYGVSYPTEDASTKNLQYLSVDQSLADLANLIVQLKNINPNLRDSKVILFGGSYAGNMAAWFRVKYPHLLQGAVSSSGPLLAEADFYKYLEVVNVALKTEGSETCAYNVERGTQELQELLKTPAGVDRINKLFNICGSLNVTIKRDVESVYGAIIDTISGVVQYAAPLEIRQEVCDAVDSLDRSPLEGLALIVARDQGPSCLDVSFKSMIEEYSNGKWGTAATGGSRQWIYQTCTEFGYYQTTNSDKQPFGNNTLSLEYFIDMCKGFFGDIFTEQAVEILYSGVERTNLQYGALTPDVSDIIFLHGTVDPWHSLGVLKDLSKDAPAIVVPGASHCADMQSISTRDSADMLAAKRSVISLVEKWIN